MGFLSHFQKEQASLLSEIIGDRVKKPSHTMVAPHVLLRRTVLRLRSCD